MKKHASTVATINDIKDSHGSEEDYVTIAIKRSEKTNCN